MENMVKIEKILFNCFNNYHSNIKRTVALNPSKLLDSELTNTSGFYKFNFYRKGTKLPSPWTCKTSKRNKENTVNGDLHRLKRISSKFD